MTAQPYYRVNDTIDGRYQVHQALMGGMGEVYLCLDLETNEPYALKTFHAPYAANQRLRQAFNDEVATWIALEKHPNIVRCFYLRSLRSQPFMFLEWIAPVEGYGTDLRSWLHRRPLAMQMALDMTIDICRGLIHADQKHPGIVHRDLKPANILVSQSGIAKITDFGLAKLTQYANMAAHDLPDVPQHLRSIDSQQAIAGTPRYMAPEQWQASATLDARTDIYAVGCILYEMLTARPLFPASQLRELRRQHLEVPVTDLLSRVALPEPVSRILTRCLAKHPEERFATVSALLAAVTENYHILFGQAPKAMLSSEELTSDDLNNRGVTYDLLHLFDLALSDYNRAIALNPTAGPFYNNRGATYFKLRQFEQALGDHTRAIQLNGAHAQAYMNCGSSNYELGRYDDAVSNYSEALRLDPNLVMAYTNRGAAYAKLGYYDEALADFSAALERAPDDAPTYLNIGALLGNLGHLHDALIYFEQAARLGDANGQLLADQARHMLHEQDTATNH